jgi:hypothetical protein
MIGHIALVEPVRPAGRAQEACTGQGGAISPAAVV